MSHEPPLSFCQHGENCECFSRTPAPSSEVERAVRPGLEDMAEREAFKAYCDGNRAPWVESRLSVVAYRMLMAPIPEEKPSPLEAARSAVIEAIERDQRNIEISAQLSKALIEIPVVVAGAVTPFDNPKINNHDAYQLGYATACMNFQVLCKKALADRARLSALSGPAKGGASNKTDVQ